MEASDWSIVKMVTSDWSRVRIKASDWSEELNGGLYLVRGIEWRPLIG